MKNGPTEKNKPNIGKGGFGMLSSSSIQNF